MFTRMEIGPVINDRCGEDVLTVEDNQPALNADRALAVGPEFPALGSRVATV